MIDWKGWKVKYANAFGGSERALFLLQHDLFANFPAILAQHEADQKVIAAAKRLRDKAHIYLMDGNGDVAVDKAIDEFDKVVKP